MRGGVKKASAARSAAKHVAVVAEESVIYFSSFTPCTGACSHEIVASWRWRRGASKEKEKGKQTRATVLPDVDKSDGN
jgi:hypothetical protein